MALTKEALKVYNKPSQVVSRAPSPNLPAIDAVRNFNDSLQRARRRPVAATNSYTDRYSQPIS